MRDDISPAVNLCHICFHLWFVLFSIIFSLFFQCVCVCAIIRRMMIIQVGNCSTDFKWNYLFSSSRKWFSLSFLSQSVLDLLIHSIFNRPTQYISIRFDFLSNDPFFSYLFRFVRSFVWFVICVWRFLYMLWD